MKRLLTMAFIIVAVSAQPTPEPTLKIRQPEEPAMARLATYERMMPALMKQRDDSTQLAQNLMLQITVLTAERDALAKELAELKAAPKP